MTSRPRSAARVGFLLLCVASCRAPHELELFEEPPPKAPPAMPEPCPPELAMNGDCEECQTDAECAAGAPACLAGRCVACTSDAHCPKDQACNVAASRCAKRCDPEGVCDDKEAKICDVTLGLCVACLSDTDCTKPDRLRCDVTLTVCAGCVNDADCGDAGSCEPEQAKCTAPKP